MKRRVSPIHACSSQHNIRHSREGCKQTRRKGGLEDRVDVHDVCLCVSRVVVVVNERVVVIKKVGYREERQINCAAFRSSLRR